MDSTKLQLLADAAADGQGVEPELVLPHPRVPRHTRTPRVPVSLLNSSSSDSSSEEWQDNKEEKSKGKGNVILPGAGGRPRGRPRKVSGAASSRPPPSNSGMARGRPPGRGRSRSSPPISTELVSVAGPGPGEEREEVSGSLTHTPRKILIASPYMGLNREINGHCALYVYQEMLQIAKPTEEPELVFYGKSYFSLAYVESVTSSMVSCSNSELLFFLFLHQSLPTLEEMHTWVCSIRNKIEIDPLAIGFCLTGDPQNSITKVFSSKENNCLSIGFENLVEKMKETEDYKKIPKFFILKGIDYNDAARNILDSVSEYLEKEEAVEGDLHHDD